MNLFNQVLLFATVPLLTMIAGGIVAIFKKPSGNLRSLILHFAGGVVFSVVAVEILPDILKNRMPVMTVAGFSFGFISMMGIKKLMEGKEEKKSVHRSINIIPWGLIAGVGVDIFIDGLLLGIGFAAGNTEGILLAIALSFELFSLGIATATSLAANHVPIRKSIIVIICLALIFFISAIAGISVLHNASNEVMDVVLSFGLAALLFLVTEELLREAHEEKETVWNTSAFFVGFLLFLILGMYV